MANKELEALQARVDDARKFLHVDEKAEELKALEDQMASPGFWDDSSKAQEVSKAASDIRDLVAEYDAAASRLDDASAAYELSAEDEGFASEYESAMRDLEKMLDALEVSVVLGPVRLRFGHPVDKPRPRRP